MGVIFDPFSGQLTATGGSGGGGGGGVSVGTPVTGGNPNSTVIVDNDGNLSTTQPMTNGQVIIGATGSAPVAGNINGDGQVIVTPGPNTINLSLGNNLPAIKIADGSVDDVEFQALDGVTGNIQTQIDNKLDATEKGAPDGVATLDNNGKIPVSQLPSAVLTYEGTWDAATNTPTLADGDPASDAGQVYIVAVPGTQDLGSGPIDFIEGDWVIYNGTVWQKTENTNPVDSVNGQQGIVVLDTGDIAEGSNLYFTDERAQDAVASILQDSASVDFVYDDPTNTITADVIPGGVDHDQLLNFQANKHVDHLTVQIATPASSGLTGGGDITATRTLSVDIVGTPNEVSADNADSILIWDSSAAELKSQTRAQFLAGIPTPSPGDIPESSFSASPNVVSPTDITGFAFASATVRSFKAQMSVHISANVDLNEIISIDGIQKAGDWSISVIKTGDNSQIQVSISPSGQMQYMSTEPDGWVDTVFKFRALTTST